MVYQGFTPFIGTKYSDILHFQGQCGRSVIYDKESIYYIYDYLETSLAPTIILTKTQPNIDLSEFPILETTPITEERTNTLNNDAAVFWDTITHYKITMDPTISALTSKYFYACECTSHFMEPYVNEAYPYLLPKSVIKCTNTT